MSYFHSLHIHSHSCTDLFLHCAWYSGKKNLKIARMVHVIRVPYSVTLCKLLLFVLNFLHVLNFQDEGGKIDGSQTVQKPSSKVLQSMQALGIIIWIKCSPVGQKNFLFTVVQKVWASWLDDYDSSCACQFHQPMFQWNCAIWSFPCTSHKHNCQ